MGGGHKRRALAHGYSMPPFGVSKAAGMEANQTFRGTALEAALLIKPPALRGVSNFGRVFAEARLVSDPVGALGRRH